MIRDLDTRDKNCRDQIEKVTQDGQNLAARVPGELRRIYDRLLNRPTKNDVFQKALVSIEDDNCGGCFLKVTPSVRNMAKKGQTVACENCGALLYYAF